MINIGTLDQRGQIITTTYSEDANFGDRQRLGATGADFWFRRIPKKSEVKYKGDATFNIREIEIVLRYRDDIDLDDGIKIYANNNNSGTFYVYNIEGKEEIGRAQGLRLYLSLAYSITV